MATVVLQKYYEYKIYRAGVYVGNYSRDEVISDFEVSNQLNSAGSQVVVKLARPSDSYGEGTDVDFNLQVKVYCYDNDTPNGTLVFTGYVADYAPIYGGEDSEHIEVTLLGYGSELDNFIIQAGESTDQQNTTVDSDWNFSNNGTYALGQTFVAGASGSVSRIETRLELEGFVWGTGSQTVTLNLYSGSPSTTLTLLGTTTAVVTSVSYGTVSFAFATPVTGIVSGQTYFFEMISVNASGGGPAPIYANYNSTSVYASGSIYTASNTGWPTKTYTVQSANDLWFKVYLSSGSTKAAYSSVDPSTILKAILDDYKARGGTLSYDNTTIDLTATTVTYTFNTNTVWEGLQKILELAPQGWYFYIDQATNMVHFHKMVSTPAYRLTLGSDITSLKVEKRTEDIVNTVYFTGGDTGAGILYKVYKDSGSIALYGSKLLKYTDQRVTNSATADIIANTIINNKKAPEIRTTVSVVDNAGDPYTGQDIEAIKLGDVISFANFGSWSPSLWDQGQWDVMFWDYNVKQLETLALQIVRLDYKPEKITLSLSTVALDVNKRIEDINRNLTDSQTVNNPTTPS